MHELRVQQLSLVLLHLLHVQDQRLLKRLAGGLRSKAWLQGLPFVLTRVLYPLLPGVQNANAPPPHVA